MSRFRSKRLVRAIAVIAAVGAIVGGVAVVGASGDGGSGEKPLLITAEAQRRTLVDEVTIQGTLGRVEQRQVDAAEAARVSAIHIDDGATVDAGQAILSLDGRDSIATSGTFPFFRPLDVGSEGDDVRQLEEILRAAGHRPGTVDRTYTEETRAALAAWQATHGYPNGSPERGETVTVSLQQGTGYRIGGQSAGGVVIAGGKSMLSAAAVDEPAIDLRAPAGAKETDNPRMAITALDARVVEGAPARFRITVDDVPIEDTDLHLEVGGSADPEDVVAVDRFRYGAGLWSVTVDVPTRQDDLVEEDETIVLEVIDSSGYSVSSSSDDATTTLVDDDLPELHLVGGSAVAEGDDDRITIVADQAPTEATQVVLTTAGTATANDDFVPVPTHHVLPAGQTRLSVDVRTLADEDIEDDERVVVTLSPSAGYTIGSAASTVTTIVKAAGEASRPVVTLRTTATHIDEGQSLPLVVALDRPVTHDLPIELVYFGTARPGEDYTPAAGRIVVPAGSTSLAVSVPTVSDDAVEEDRTIGARLAQSDRYRLGTPSEAQAAVESDDVPELTLLGAAGAVVEGATSTFTIVADQAPVEDISVSFSTLGSATEGQDFESTGGTVVLPAGQTSLTVDLRTLADDVSFRPTDMVVGEWPTRVGQVFVEEGETVQPGTPLLSLTDPELTVTLRSSASDRTKLAQGQAVTVKIVGGTAEAPGVISQLDDTASVDQQTGEQFYEGRVDVDGLEAADGASVTIEVVLNQVDDALTVPIASVKQDGSGQDVVRVIDLEGAGEITEVPVETGMSEGSYLEVVGGLDGGEVVIVEVDAPTDE